MSDQKKNSTPHSGQMERAEMQDEQVQDLHAQLLREKAEPSEGYSPVPMFLVFAFAALCFWGGLYLMDNSGGFRWDAYSPDFNPTADAPVAIEIPLFKRGAKVFRNQCAQCHQASGQGVAGVYPPLAGSEWVLGNPEVLGRILVNGLNGPIEVMGQNYNGNMPAFGPNGLNLKAKQLAGVMTYIRQEWGNAEADVSVEMVEGYLESYSARGAVWSASELHQGLGN
jgi:mono/diheme cytochrome c family protein